MTLRALYPSYRGRWMMWGRSCSVMGFRRHLGKRVTHLYALEQVFDRSVELARKRYPAASRKQVAKAVAQWVADEARTELVLREMHSDWLDRATSELTRPQEAPAAVLA